MYLREVFLDTWIARSPGSSACVKDRPCQCEGCHWRTLDALTVPASPSLRPGPWAMAPSVWMMSTACARRMDLCFPLEFAPSRFSVDNTRLHGLRILGEIAAACTRGVTRANGEACILTLLPADVPRMWVPPSLDVEIPSLHSFRTARPLSGHEQSTRAPHNLLLARADLLSEGALS
jgi:hypothetical protein